MTWTPDSHTALSLEVLTWWGVHHPETFDLRTALQAQALADAMLDALHGCGCDGLAVEPREGER